MHPPVNARTVNHAKRRNRNSSPMKVVRTLMIFQLVLSVIGLLVLCRIGLESARIAHIQRELVKHATEVNSKTLIEAPISEVSEVSNWLSSFAKGAMRVAFCLCFLFSAIAIAGYLICQKAANRESCKWGG